MVTVVINNLGFGKVAVGPETAAPRTAIDIALTATATIGFYTPEEFLSRLREH